MRRLPALLLPLLALLALVPSGATAQTRQAFNIETGPWVMRLGVDSVTGRVFATNQGENIPGVGRTGSVTVIEPSGATTTFMFAPNDWALEVAVGTSARKVVVTHPNASRVTVIDADTLERTTYATGYSPQSAVFVGNRAYVAGADQSTYNPANTPAASGFSGTLTEIDFATGTSRVMQVPSFQPERLATNGHQVFIAGRTYQFASYLPTWVQSFDIAAGTFGPVVPAARRLVDMVMSSSGQDLYVLSHVGESTEVRASLLTFDAATLALKRTTPLPEHVQFTMFDGVLVQNGPAILGGIAIDPSSGTVFALDQDNRRFSMVDGATGALSYVGVESIPRSMAFDAVNGNLYLSMPFDGYAAVYSATGERLDTVPTVARVPGGPNVGTPSAIAVNPTNGAVYVANPWAGQVTMITTPASLASVSLNATDFWWNPADSGWGLYAEQQGTTLFGALFLREAGVARWYVMSEGKRAGNGSFTGTLYRTRGPIGSGVNATAVGTLTFTPAGVDGAGLSWEIGGVKRSTAVSRLAFGGDRSCGWDKSSTAKAGRPANYTSLYANPDQLGWGVALSQRGDTAFGVMYGYDANAEPSWTVMSAGTRGGVESFGGALYRVAGAGLAEVGTMGITFGADGAASLSTVADGRSFSSALKRQVFAPLTSDCGG